MCSKGDFINSGPGFIVFSLFMSIFALLVPQTAMADQPGASRTLVFGVENDFAGFDPVKARGLAICGAIANNTINERLFALDDDGRLIPILGLSAEPTSDGLTWTVQLRQGVRFHDQTPFNAEAVTAHFSRLLDQENRFADRVYLQPLEAVETVAEHTVQFKLKQPWPAFLSTLSNPRSLFGFIPSPAAVRSDRQLRSPVGTGPFMFKEWVTGDRFVVVRNPDYWQKGKPFLDRIIFKPMIDHQTRFAGLKAGQIDAIWADHGNTIRKAETDSSLVLHTGEGCGAEIMLLNTAVPPLNDVRVRRALALAWNQDLYVKMSYQDTIPVVHHPFGEEHSCQDTGYLEHDLKKARILMDEFGEPVELEVLHSNARRGQEVGEITQQLFKALGVRVNSRGLEFAPVIQKVLSRNYQMATWRIPSLLDYGPYLLVTYSSGSRRNFTGYQNAALDDLLSAQSVETDPVKRSRLLCDIIKTINQDAVILYRGGRRFHIISRPRVKGIDPIRHGIPDMAMVRIED